MRSSHRWLFLLAGMLVWLAGCAGPATRYQFPERDYQPNEYDVDDSVQDGLLWGENTETAVEDYRSRRMGDIVIVRVEENANAKGNAETATSRESSIEAGLENFFGVVEKWAGKSENVDEAALIKALMKSSFKGAGETKRTEQLKATIPCQVRQVLPNGDLYIRGTKTIQINQEESNLYLSGVVRPYDIDMQNTVSSTRILDARIDFSGRGVISDKQGPGLGQRGVDALWPF